MNINQLRDKIAEIEKIGQDMHRRLEEKVRQLPGNVDKVRLGEYIDSAKRDIDTRVLGAKRDMSRELLSRKTADQATDKDYLRGVPVSTRALLEQTLRQEGPRDQLRESPSVPRRMLSSFADGYESLGGWLKDYDTSSESAPEGIARFAGELASDPLNLIGAGAMKVARKAAPYALGAAGTGYAQDTEAGVLPRFLRPAARSALGELGESTVAPRGALSVVKPKGGNWLSGSVEDALKPLRQYEDPAVRAAAINTPHLASRVAVNDWVQGPLTKYVKNQMATPEDPVRALAEQGILHMPPIEGLDWVPNEVVDRRRWTKFPEEGMAQSDLAKQWEIASDYSVTPYAAGEIAQSSMVLDNPWSTNLPRAEKVYQASKDLGTYSELGLPHLTDELRNATRADSDLPRQLRIEPEKLSKMSMDAAVRHVAKINEWRAKNAAEANAALANNAATALHKEYPDQGFRWVELRAPEKTGRNIKVLAESEDMADELSPAAHDAAREYGLEEGTDEFDDFVVDWLNENGHYATTEFDMDESHKALRDALKYEGDTMGHCVGGYCDDVLSGMTKIYSLRDAKGQPHVTVEVAPPTDNKYTTSLKSEFGDAWEDYYDPTIDAGYEPSGARIVQIKGKGNKKPKDEYLPFVQDFVRSGQWSDVGDLSNTGLRKMEWGPDIIKGFKEHNISHPEGYGTSEEVNEAINALNKARGFAKGGSVVVQPWQETATVGTRGYKVNTISDLQGIINALTGGTRDAAQEVTL
jgi:hypothetical protein